jgi:conjugative relaxase-like TrwC/TraI family protein
MLTISKPLSAGQAQTYHQKEFTAAEQNYWRQGDTIQGEWHGKLAETYGIHGAVGPQEFARLSEGQDPRDGEQLVRHRAVQQYQSATGEMIAPVEHRAGWDATFSAPKSISLTALVGGDDRVREAHRTAVNVALDELERYTQARIGGNHPAETTGRFIAAKFEHDTARPVDGYAAPQLHTHVVIFNMTQREDGSTRALQPRSLFESQQFATAVYQAQLTHQLRNLGYEITSGKSGAPEIKGYTREYLDASSPRRQQIEEALARSGRSGPEAAQIAAHSTRDRKEIRTPADVLAAHLQIAAEYGNQANKVVSEARERALLRTMAGEQEQKLQTGQQRAQEALSYARDRNFEREAVVDERLLFRDALRRGMGEITYGQVRAGFDERVSSGEFRAVEPQRHQAAHRFTTEETVRAERDVLQRMLQGQDSVPAIASREHAFAHVESRPDLNTAQRAAIEQVLASKDQIQGLQGLAGTGKTSALESIRIHAEQNGYAVEGFAPTSRAARQLREAGIPADTLQAFLVRGSQQQATADPSSRHLYMIDESSLAGTQQMRDFLSRISPQDKVLLVGDTRQHQGVDAGKPFEELQLAGMRTAQLDQIIRQKDPQLLAVVEHLAKNETAVAVALLHQQGRITEIADPQQRIEAIAKQYAALPEKTLVVSPDNVSRVEINQAVRRELQALGTLDSVGHNFTVLAQRSDITGAERSWAASYQPGDVLHYHRGSKELEVDRRSYAQVIATSANENLLTVQKPNGEQLTYDPSRLRGVSVYRELEREFSVGDRLQFTAPNRELGVANRDLATITEIGPGQRLSVRLADSERTLTFDPQKMPHFDHGYAVTSHSAQGLTAERVLINIDSAMHPDLINTRLAYVSISRGQIDAHIFTNDATRLSENLSRDVTKTSAAPVLQPPTEQPSHAKEPTVSTKQDLPASIYVANIPPELMQQDVRTIKQGFAESVPPAEIALNIVDQHWQGKGEPGATAAHVYAADLVQSVTRHPEYSAEQHAALMQPTPADRARWEPLMQTVPVEVADSFQWSGSNGTVQSYRHESTHQYLHVDGLTGQFYDRDKNPLSREAALDRALPQESFQQGTPSAPSQGFEQGARSRDADQAFAIS